VAGDYYDFIPVDVSLAKGSEPSPGLGIVIADVSDKGMPAALFMALTRSIVRASVGRAPSPADGIAHANRLICADSTGGMFVTLFYALLDPERGEITYVNAGHNPPLLYRRSDHAEQGQLAELTRTGMAMGVVADSPFEQRTVQLDPGDFILLYTDGVTEATDAQGREFGTERLRRAVADQCRSSAANIVAALERAVHDFISSTAPFDDVTIVAIKSLR
jgi:sigma-B regulation protein RsbU (phosphoserine phosphatase)